MRRFEPPPRVAFVSSAGISLLVLAFPASSQVTISSRAMDIEVSGRVQFQLETTSCTEATPALDSACASEAPGFDMFLRRARLAVEATIDDRLSVKLEPDFSDIDALALKDAWGRYAFADDGLAVKAGHFKRPFDGFHLTSSSRLPFERAVVVPGVPNDALPSYSGLTKAAGLSDRDIGLAIEGVHGDGRFAWWLGAFTGGSGSPSSDTNASKQFIARAKLELDVGGSPLGLAGAGALSDAPYIGTNGGSEAEYYSNVELFAELGDWGRDGLLLQVGLVLGDNPSHSEIGLPIDLGAGDEFADMLAWQGVAAYRIPLAGIEWLEAVSPSLRVSYADPTEVDDDEVLAFTPGVILSFHGRNHMAVTWDFAGFAAEGVRDESSFKTFMQFHF